VLSHGNTVTPKHFVRLPLCEFKPGGEDLEYLSVFILDDSNVLTMKSAGYFVPDVHRMPSGAIEAMLSLVRCILGL